ncbi:MAG: hypothetical protein U7127_20815 [Phormidium sp.]
MKVRSHKSRKLECDRLWRCASRHRAAMRSIIAFSRKDGDVRSASDKLHQRSSKNSEKGGTPMLKSIVILPKM